MLFNRLVGDNAFAVPYRRSRVTPDESCTSAALPPTNLLNNMDLPTLGLPIMAMILSDILFIYTPCVASLGCYVTKNGTHVQQGQYVIHIEA